MSPELWKQRLEERGIYDAAHAAGWQPYEWRGAMGWAYPLFQANGQKWIMPEQAGVAAGRPAQRWKAFDSQHNPKFLWGYKDQVTDNGDLRQPVGCAYYWLPGGDVIEAIKNADGQLIIACGEPDMLTFAAVGVRNVTSFFGEGSIPPNVVEVFRKLGVQRVTYYPDNDNTGWDDAQKLIAAFADSMIHIDVYGLPVEYAWQDVKDINDLWVATGFNADLFRAALAECKSLNAALAPAEPVEQVEWENNDLAWQKYHEDIERALGAVWKRGAGWSKPLRCIFASHDNDDRSPKAGYHKTAHTFRCFKCGSTWKGDEVAVQLGVERPKSVPKQQALAASPLGVKHAGVNHAPAEIPIYSSADSLRRYKERLHGINAVEHIRFPFEALRHLGGFCDVMPLGKLIGVLGLSGGGKTSFIETLTDAWRQMGVSVMWWGPEWSWEEMTDRAVQRYGGLTITEMMKHETWLAEDAKGIPLQARGGVKYPQELLDRSERIVDQIMEWEGQAYYLDKMDVTLDQLLLQAQTKIDALAADGRKPKIFVCDYIQLAEITGARGDGERIPRAVSLIKAFVTDNRMLGVLGTQTRKNDSEEARKEGELLTAEAAQFFRDDKTNLFITLNPEFDDEGNMTGEGVINVVKNSGGRRGKVAAKPNPSHLRWDDVKVKSTAYSQIIEEGLNIR